MKKNIYKVFGDRMTDLLTQRSEETSRCESKIRDANALATEAMEQQAAALRASDAAAHAAGTDALTKARATAAFYAARLNQVRGSEIISKEEHDELYAAMDAYQKSVHDDACKRVIELMEQIERICHEASDEIKKGDKLLQKWDTNIHKVPRRDVSFNTDKLTALSNGVVLCYQYRLAHGVGNNGHYNKHYWVL